MDPNAQKTELKSPVSVLYEVVLISYIKQAY